MKKTLNVSEITNELKGSAFFPKKEAIVYPVEQTRHSETTPLPTQQVTYPSKVLSKNMSTEDIERLTFRLRKVQKFRVNADVPMEWKERLDDLAFQLKVGKYELLLYIIGQYLGEIAIEER